MKRIVPKFPIVISVGVLTFLAALLVHGADAVRAEAANLISNPSVETPSSNPLLPQDWYKDRFGNNTAVFTYPVAGYDGAKAIKVALTRRKSGDAKWYFKDVPVVAGQEYVFSDHYLSTIKSFLVMRVTSADQKYSYTELAQLPASSTWATKEVTFTAPAGAVSVTIFHLIRSVGSLTTDGFSLTTKTIVPPPPPPPPPEPPDPTNFILNPSLEESLADGSLPLYWAKGGWGENLTVFTYPVAGYDGAKAAKIEMTQYANGDAKWYFQDVAVEPGTSYLFSDSYMSNVPTLLVARYEKSEGGYLYIDLATIGASSSWAAAQGMLIVPSGVKSLTIFHLLNQVGHLTVDNFALRKAAEPPKFSRGMVSFDFDDGWQSMYSNGLPILNAAGIKSTQYVITDYLEGDQNYISASQILMLQGQGHEIGAHSRSHPHLPVLSDTLQRYEILGSRNDLLGIGVSPVNSFAYPYGEYNSQIIQIIKESGYLAARTAMIEGDGFNHPDTSPYQLRTQSVEYNTTLDDIRTWVDTAALKKVWLILVFHKVEANGGQYSVTPQFLQEVVNYVKQSDVSVVTASQGILQMSN